MVGKSDRVIPYDKYDVEAAERAVAAGYPKVDSYPAELLAWTKDGNWPVARVLAPFLSGIGEPLAHYIRQALNGNDEGWKYFLLNDIVAPLIKLRVALNEELRRMAATAILRPML